ncbi:hypothetical protein E2K69_17240, partial [Escherichia coli]
MTREAAHMLSFEKALHS